MLSLHVDGSLYSKIQDEEYLIRRLPVKGFSIKPNTVIGGNPHAYFMLYDGVRALLATRSRIFTYYHDILVQTVEYDSSELEFNLIGEDLGKIVCFSRSTVVRSDLYSVTFHTMSQESKYVTVSFDGGVTHIITKEDYYSKIVSEYAKVSSSIMFVIDVGSGIEVNGALTVNYLETEGLITSLTYPRAKLAFIKKKGYPKTLPVILSEALMLKYSSEAFKELYNLHMADAGGRTKNDVVAAVATGHSNVGLACQLGSMVYASTFNDRALILASDGSNAVINKKVFKDEVHPQRHDDYLVAVGTLFNSAKPVNKFAVRYEPSPIWMLDGAILLPNHVPVKARYRDSNGTPYEFEPLVECVPANGSPPNPADFPFLDDSMVPIGVIQTSGVQKALYLNNNELIVV